MSKAKREAEQRVKEAAAILRRARREGWATKEMEDGYRRTVDEWTNLE